MKNKAFLHDTAGSYHENVSTNHQTDVFGERPHEVDQRWTQIRRTCQNQTLRPDETKRTSERVGRHHII